MKIYSVALPSLLLLSGLVFGQQGISSNHQIQSREGNQTLYPDVYERGMSTCTEISFEGVGDNVPVGLINGFPAVTFGSSWLGVIDADSGGSGNFANEPSPSTAAYFLTPADPITFDTFVHQVEVYYSAAALSLPVSLYAWDGPNGTGTVVDVTTGNVIGTSYDGAPCSGDPFGNFCLWGVMRLSSNENNIRSITLVGAVANYFGFDQMTYCSGLAPSSDFNWTPQEPEVNQEVHFQDLSLGSDLDYAWDFQSDGVIDDTSVNPAFVFDQAGPYQVTLTVSNAYGIDTVVKTVLVVAGDRPLITAVNRSYGGVFLEGSTVNNTFNVSVDWRGNPGLVRFSIAGAPPSVVTGNAQGAAKTYAMGEDFSPSFSAIPITITAVNQAGDESDPHIENLYIFPYPNWLNVSLTQGGLVTTSVGGGQIRTGLKFEFPKPHLEGAVTIPSWVPYLNGSFGITDTYGRVQGEVSSLGTGSLSIFGQTGFSVFEQNIVGSLFGSGTMNLLPPKGLQVLSAGMGLRLAGTVGKEAGLLEVIPVLETVSNWPGMSWINELATLKGQITVAHEGNFSWRQNDAGDLVFNDGTAGLGLDLKGTLSAQLASGRVEADAWVAGGGSLTIGVGGNNPSLFRGGEVHLQVGLHYKIDWILDLENEFTANAYCAWPASASPCHTGTPSLFRESGRLHPIHINYAQYGAYNQRVNQAVTRGEKGETRSVDTVVFANVFPGAAPQLIATNSGDMLIWTYQDPNDSVLQSTEIAYAVKNGGSWSAMQLIEDNTAAEFSPTAAMDENGKVVAVWLRIADPNFTTPIPTLEDLPLFYGLLEVVTATYNPASGTWSPITAVTHDAVLDNNPVISRSASGQLMLSWLSFSDSRFQSSDEAPATLWYCTWSAASGSWSAPMAIADNLSGVMEHVAAYNGSEAIILLSQDSDPTVASDDLLLGFQYSDGSFDAGTLLADSGTHRAPKVTYDSSGDAHIVWLRNGDLVHANLNDPNPVVIRARSQSLAFYGADFLGNTNGNLTLLWQEGVENSPAKLLARIYDPVSDTWSEDLRLTSDEQEHGSMDGFYGNNGILNVTYLSTEIQRETRDVTIEGQVITLTNLPSNGPSDLRVLEHTLVVDLGTDGDQLWLTPDQPEEGEASVLNVTINNLGDFPVTSFQVGLYKGDPAGGNLLQSVTVPGLLPAGGSVNLDIAFDWPGNDHDLYVVADSSHGITEVSEINNTAILHVTNQPPNAVLIADVFQGDRPLTVSFDASGSRDPEGEPINYGWAFADGSLDEVGAQVSHTFERGGRYLVHLMVNDPHLASDTATILIDVHCRLDQAFYDNLVDWPQASVLDLAVQINNLCQ